MNKNGVLLTEELTVERLISAFYYQLPESFDYAGEAHPGWEFVYVEQGRVKVQAGADTYILKSGEMVCHQPMEYHCIRPYHSAASVIILCFTCQGARMDWFRNKILSISPRQKQYLNDAVAAGEGLLLPKTPLDIARDGTMERSPMGTVAQEQTIKNTIELLALSLLASESTERQARAERYEQHLHRRNLASEIMTYLQENLHQPIDLNSLSHQFSYSLSSIRRIFQNETGISIMAYLTQLRMEKAKQLLKKSSLSVENIAASVGYRNVYYFSNAFKAKTGKSPSQYRKSKQAE